MLQSEATSGLAVHKELRGALPIGSKVFDYKLAGDRYQFTAARKACLGPYTSQGAGVITGQRIEVSYRSTYSVGSCIGTISADGNRMISDCRDSVCGPFRTVIDRR